MEDTKTLGARRTASKTPESAKTLRRVENLEMPWKPQEPEKSQPIVKGKRLKAKERLARRYQLAAEAAKAAEAADAPDTPQKGSPKAEDPLWMLTRTTQRRRKSLSQKGPTLVLFLKRR